MEEGRVIEAKRHIIEERRELSEGQQKSSNGSRLQNIGVNDGFGCCKNSVLNG